MVQITHESVIGVFRDGGLPGIRTVVVSFDRSDISIKTAVHGVPDKVCRQMGRLPRPGDQIELRTTGDSTEVVWFETVLAAG